MRAPIPARYLCHSATLQTRTIDAYQKETLTKVADLRRVRFLPYHELVLTASNTQVRLEGLLFFDSLNSRPKGTTFSVGQRILYNGKSYLIEGVDELWEQNKLHHYEVALSG